MKGKLGRLIAKWFLGGLFRDIADGRKGPTLKKAYWSTVGAKTEVGAVLGVLYAAWMYFDPAMAEQYRTQALGVIGVLVSAGLVDSQWRTGKPPLDWAEAFHTIMSAGPIVSALFAVALEVLPRFCADCEHLAGQLQVVAAGVGSATAWLAARFAEPPAGKADPKEIDVPLDAKPA